jgi:hypothetical protein
MAVIFWMGIAGLAVALAVVPVEKLLDAWEMYQRKRYRRFVERMNRMEQKQEDEAPRDPLAPELRQVRARPEPPVERQTEPWNRRDAGPGVSEGKLQS